MSVIATAVKAMMDGGMGQEAIIAAISAMEAALRDEAANDPQPSKGALRQRAYRERHNASQSVTSDESDVQASQAQVPPNEYISNPPEKSLSPKGDAPLSAEIATIVSEWNEMAGRTGCTKVRGKLDGPRQAAIRARLRDHGIGGVREAIAAVERSPFCRGETSDWKAGFDFFVRPKNFTKLLEGGYDPPARSASSRLTEPGNGALYQQAAKYGAAA